MDGATIAKTFESLTRIDYLTMGAVVLILAALLLLLIRRQPKHVSAYCTENGQVMVSRSAIVELVQTSCEQIKEVSKPQVRMRVKGGKKHFDVYLKLASGGHLRSIEEMLQAHLRKALTENLGIENLGRINIVATGFKSGRMESSSSITKKHPESAAEREGDLEDSDEAGEAEGDTKHS